MNANKALDDLLSTKGSIDARRWRAVWDLGVLLCQTESQVAATVQEARTICSQMALGIWMACSQSIFEAKTGYLVAVKEAKTTRSHLLQEAKATCSKAICKAEAQKMSQVTMLHKEHGKYMQDLEEQAIEEEGKSHNDFFTTCQAVLYSSPPLLHTTSYSGKHLHHVHLLHHERPPPQKNSQLPPFHLHRCPNNLPSPKSDTLCQIPWRACL